MNFAVGAAALGSLAWLAGWVMPFQPFRIRETLCARSAGELGLATITALVPARDEATTIARTLDGLLSQDTGLKVIVVDDQSADDTAAIARRHALRPTVIAGSAPPAGWLGKMWALHQGLGDVQTPYVLLIDADIAFSPGVLTALLERLESENLAAASLMAELRQETAWEKLLSPAYVFFFRLLYPFSLVRSANRAVAAAAGGCVLLRRDALIAIGGFGRLRDAIIDDCSLARLLKDAGYGIWLGLTRDVHSLRAYPRLQDFRELVSRSAFAQLNFSIWRLSACTLAMIGLFIGPVFLATQVPSPAGWLGVAGLVAMLASYVPILRYYGLTPLRCISLPLVAAGYLEMTWHSAIRYWNGTRTVWKGRSYSSQEGPN